MCSYSIDPSEGFKIVLASDSASSKLFLKPKLLGMKVVEPTLGDEANGDNDCVEQSLVPPTVDDPDFALRSFLTDLGVPEENQTDANLSQFQGLI